LNWVAFSLLTYRNDLSRSSGATNRGHMLPGAGMALNAKTLPCTQSIDIRITCGDSLYCLDQFK
jgi:hypothetical protein